MQNGATVTVSATGVQDTAGNLISPTHNTASGTGIGGAPVFSNVAADPAQAHAGETVRITFTASETLDGDPEVSVNGHAASWISGGKAVDFTYGYVVQETDALGMAGVSVAGFDPAGNLGSLSDNAALEIVEETTGLPVHVWPVGLALLAAGIIILVTKRRFGTALLILALLASSSALAASATSRREQVWFRRRHSGR